MAPGGLRDGKNARLILQIVYFFIGFLRIFQRCVISMDEMEFDRTRKAIGAHRLEDQDRKKILQKMTEAGGQVMKEKSMPQQEGKQDRGQKRPTGGSSPSSDLRLPSQLAREKQRLDGERVIRLKQAREAEEKAASGFSARFMIKLRCKLGGITPYGRDVVLPAFMSKLNLDLRRALMEANILWNDLFFSNPATAKAIIQGLDQKQPLYVEILDRGGRLYDRYEISELTSPYTASPDDPVPLDAIRAPLFSILRKLYYLKPFQETYLIAAETAIEIQQKTEKKQSGLYLAKLKKIQSDWKNLMNDIFPGLVLLAQRAEMRRVEPGSRLFEDMMAVKEEDRVGKRKPGESVGGARIQQQRAEEAAAAADGKTPEEEAKESSDKTAAPDTSQEMQYGMKLMHSQAIPGMRKRFDPKNEWKQLLDRDKVLISMLFLRDFEDQYSFILTTPKIILNPVYKDGMKIDLRKKMADIYEEARSSHDAFRNYLHETEEFRKVMDEHSSTSNYVEHAKRVSLLESRRGNSGRVVRTSIRDFMGKVKSALEILIADMRGQKTIVVNLDEPMKFSSNLEGSKRLNGRPVRQCIMEAYCFAMAFASRLENGDLFGGILEMSQQEYEKSFGTGDSEPFSDNFDG